MYVEGYTLFPKFSVAANGFSFFCTDYVGASSTVRYSLFDIKSHNYTNDGTSRI